MTQQKLLRAREAADILGIGTQQLYKLSWKKQISRVRVGGGWRWPLEGINEYIQRNYHEATK